MLQNFSGMEKNQSSVGGCLEFWAKLFLTYSNEKIQRATLVFLKYYDIEKKARIRRGL